MEAYCPAILNRNLNYNLRNVMSLQDNVEESPCMTAVTYHLYSFCHSENKFEET